MKLGQKRNTRFVVLSVCLHLLLLGFILFPRAQRATPTAPEKVVIEVRESRSKKQSVAGSSKFNSKNLFKPLKFMPGALAKKNSQTDSQSLGEWSLLEPGESLDFQKSVEVEAFLDRIRKNIDQNTIYPPDLANKRIDGSVVIEGFLKPDGTLMRENLRTWSAAPLLETYALTTVLDTLKNPLPPYLWSKGGNVRVKMHFIFHYYTIGTSYAYTESDSSVNGNRLVFRKGRQVETKLNNRWLTF